MISPAEIAEMYYSLPAVLGESGFAAAQYLVSKGVSQSATVEPDPVMAAPIVVSGKYFDIAAADEDATRAILVLARDRFNPIDVVAWQPKAGKVFTMWSRACMLGEDELYQPRLETNGGLRVFREPLAWFLANRRGIVILDVKAAAGRLEALGPLIAEDANHAIWLQRNLARPAPQILVPNPARQVA